MTGSNPTRDIKFEKIVAKANDCASIDTEGKIAVIAGETDSYEADAMVDRRMHDRGIGRACRGGLYFR